MGRLSLLAHVGGVREVRLRAARLGETAFAWRRLATKKWPARKGWPSRSSPQASEGWRKEWDSHSSPAFGFCKLQIRQGQRSHRAEGSQGALHRLHRRLGLARQGSKHLQICPPKRTTRKCSEVDCFRVESSNKRSGRARNQRRRPKRTAETRRESRRSLPTHPCWAMAAGRNLPSHPDRRNLIPCLRRPPTLRSGRTTMTGSTKKPSAS